MLVPGVAPSPQFARTGPVLAWKAPKSHALWDASDPRPCSFLFPSLPRRTSCLTGKSWTPRKVNQLTQELPVVIGI